ncbi:MAG: acyltransferase [Hydrogenophaga sp.]|jgi:acetyltransferase-like isoleucine patch superfamily enzyme|uniref:acyltransferase n=1 Tax=Hydrogenophaga sp. TaxID=1904254 RepID=UPI00261FD738|nr:acyltransferase [Hydrogenophaga sp.]MCW5668571.1 acyltransferase [Hydrogenophaga sp.]
MDFKRHIKRLLGRPTCVLEDGARIGPRGRIFNIAQHSSQIHIGANSIIEGQLQVFPGDGYISIGQWCFVGEGTHIWSAAGIDIGNRVMISHNVNIFDNLTHPISATLRHQQFRHIATVGHPRSLDLAGKPVRIEDDAWIAAGAIVLKGVTIGKGAIVGAGSVVTRDVAAWTVVAGNPARIVRHLEPQEHASTPDTH